MNLSPLPIQKFFANNGRPLVGGKLFTYEAGTTTKIATYTDSGGLVLNTNPIILDFRGECRLWIDPQQAYKFTLSPANDTDPPTHSIWTVDNITAAPQAFDNASVDTGSVNNISLTIPQISSPVAFTRVVFKAAHTNTGPTTLQINGGTAHPLTYQSGIDIASGTIQANGIYEAIFDGLNWQLQGPTLNQNNVLYWGATGDGTTDDTAAIQAAVTAAAVAGGEVYAPAGVYRITSPIQMARNVSFSGAGGNSTEILADNCDGFEFNFFTGFGNVMLQNLLINGVNGTTRRGILVPGTLDDADETYGLTFENVLVTNFNVAMHSRTARNLTLFNCWFQNINRGLELIGKNLVVYIIGCKMTKGNGNGGGDIVGLDLDYFDYTDGAGLVPPEGVMISHSQIFGFNVCVRATACNVLCGVLNDLSGRVTGFEFTTVQHGLYWAGGVIEMSGSNGANAVLGNPLGSEISSEVEFIGVSIIGGAGLVGCTGFQINTSADTNQSNVKIRGGVITGMQGYDIIIYNPKGTNVIEGVKCTSTSVTGSISVVTPQSGLTMVRDNFCARQIQVSSTYTRAGTVRVYDNVDEGSNLKHAAAIGWYEQGTWTPADASGAGLVYVSATGTYTKNGDMVTARCQFTYPVTANATPNVSSGLPYALPAAGESYRQGNVSYSDVGTAAYVRPSLATSQFIIRKPDGTQYTNAELSGKTFTLELVYALT